MSCVRYTLTALATLLWIFGVVASVQAQTVSDPSQARIHFGPLAFQPSIRLTNVGVDNNVFNVSEIDHPTSDLTATVSPAVDAWFRMRRVRLDGRSQLDYAYFRELSDLRALNTTNSGRLELLLNRLTAYAEGSLAKGRNRQGFEVDAFADRKDDASRVGADVRLTGKAHAGLYVGRSHLDYQGNTLYLGTDLARAFNHTGTVEGVGFRYAATPLTTAALYVEQQQDRFEFSSDRNSDSLRVMPTIEFKPLALIRGRAAVGFRKLTFVHGDVPEFKGPVASVDLAYTLRGRTQFAIAASRDLEYSYLNEQNVYVLAGFNTTVTQRVGDAWDIRGTVGRFHLTYQSRSQNLGVAVGSTGETSLSAGVDVGYHIGRSRLGFNVNHVQRDSDVSLGRGYKRLVIGSSLAYVF